MKTALVSVAILGGCVDEPVQPDIANLSVRVTWTDSTRRLVQLAVPQDLPCTGVEEGFLGDSGEVCTSAAWTVSIDRRDVLASPVKCTAAHDGLFGHVPKRCEGGTASAPLQDDASEDVELVVANGVEERLLTIRGVRRTYELVEVAPYNNTNDPGIAVVNGVALHGSWLDAYFTLPGDNPSRGTASVVNGDSSRLKLSPPLGADAGTHHVRVLAYTEDDVATIAVPLEGTLRVEP